MNRTLVKVTGRIALVASVVASIAFMAAAPRLPMGAAIFLGCFFGFAGTIFLTAFGLWFYARVMLIAEGVELTSGVIASQSRKLSSANQTPPPGRTAFDPRNGSIPHNDPSNRYS